MEIFGEMKMSAEAARFVEELAPNSTMATVVALSGDLGAGKTTFTQGIARALGVEETVTSPTFVIEKIYELADQKWRHLIHIDVYRLKDPHELTVIGWDEIIADPSNLVLIEWPENVAALVPGNAIAISFNGVGESRTVTYR